MLIIKQIRRDKKLSIRGLSALTGIPRSTLSDLENNKKAPTDQELKLVARALGVKEEQLWRQPPSKNK
jgi:transcriptional regulator with XRE-family HTH domain